MGSDNVSLMEEINYQRLDIYSKRQKYCLFSPRHLICPVSRASEPSQQLLGWSQQENKYLVLKAVKLPTALKYKLTQDATTLNPKLDNAKYCQTRYNNSKFS